MGGILKMSFTTLHFFLFLAMGVLIYYLLPKKLQWVWLLVLSYLYYFTFSIKTSVFLIFTTVVTYTGGILLTRMNESSKAYLAANKETLDRAAKKAYKEKGTLLDYDSSSELYVSSELLKTSDNEGKYKIVETKTPPGYTGSWEEEVDITDKDARLSFEVVNEQEKEYTGVIRLRKTDIYTGEVLEDAEFTVLQWNRGKQTYQNDLGGQSILKFDGETGWYSTEELVLTDANQGRFKVVETKNPENYTGKYEKEVIFQKKENTDTVDLKAENTPVTLPLGNITIIKKIKEEDITWAHGNPTFSFVAEGTDLSGNPHRYEDYVTFTRGSYETDKNGYATLSVTLRNIPLGQYTVWEKPVLRYYLKDVRANTENVRIIKGAAPAYGTDPRKIASGTAALTMQNKNASLTFVNEKSRYDRYSHNDSIKNTIPVSFS